MTSPIYAVFEGDGGVNTPLRPTASVHLGGLEFQDHPTHPPTDRRRMSATDFMQVTMTVERIARMIPMLQIDITGHATTPTIDAVVSVNEALTTSSVTLTRISLGFYVLSWAAGSLPPATKRPMHAGYNCVTQVTQNINQVVVSMYTLDGLATLTLTDSALVSVMLYGEGVYI